MRPRGRLVTFEGIEGSGKTTMASRLARHLRARGRDVVVTREPGGVRLGEDIRRILLDPSYRGKLSAPSELFLYEAARAQHVVRHILPALRRGAWVVCDRFFDASTAYQGYGRRQDVAFVRRANAFAAAGLVPDRTFLLDLPARAGLARVMRRSGHRDRLEREKLSFHERVRRGYLAVARREPRRIAIVRCDRPADEVFRRVLEMLRLP